MGILNSFESNFGVFGNKDIDSFDIDITLSSSLSSYDSYAYNYYWDNSYLNIYEYKSKNENGLIHLYFASIELIYGWNAQEYNDLGTKSSSNQYNINVNFSNEYSKNVNGLNWFLGYEYIDSSNSSYDDIYYETSFGAFADGGWGQLYVVYSFGEHEILSELIDISAFDLGCNLILFDNLAFDFSVRSAIFTNNYSEVEQTTYKFKTIMDI